MVRQVPMIVKVAMFAAGLILALIVLAAFACMKVAADCEREQ